VPAADRKLVVTAPPGGRNWLFNPAIPIDIRCVGAKAPKPIIVQFEKGADREIIAIREKVDELALTGDPAKNAGAAKIALTRTRTEKDDGTRKTAASPSASNCRERPTSIPATACARRTAAISASTCARSAAGRDKKFGSTSVPVHHRGDARTAVHQPSVASRTTVTSVAAGPA